MKLNNLPTLTWNFLKLNYAEAEFCAECDNNYIVDIKNQPNGIEVSRDHGIKSEILGGMGSEAEKLFVSMNDEGLYIHVPKGVEAKSPLRIDLDCSKADGSVLRVLVEAEENSQVNIILNHISDRQTRHFVGADIKVDVHDNAVVKLVNTNLLDKSCVYFENIGAEVSERALFSLIQMELGSEATYMGVNVNLSGYKSRFEGNAGYLSRGSEKLDMNYMVNHIARKSESSLMVKGALKDRAEKCFRGTIDLRRGAKGAVGDEQEETLLLSDGVKNKTLPIILCDEEDVEGTHGASIGRLSEDVLFYMTSRGISEAEAELLMTRAKLDSIRRLIDDEESQGRIQHYLETNLR